MNVKTIGFEGLDALEITTRRLRMVVVTELGPRIAWLGRLGAENLFYWKMSEAGRGDWRLLGGHRVWASRPMADEAEDAYAADNLPCDVEQAGGAVTITGALHPFLQTRRGFRICCPDEDTFEVMSFIQNAGSMLYSGGVWCPTCTLPRPGMTFGILLGDRRLPWDVVKVVVPRTWGGHTARVNDPQISFNEEFMIIEPHGVESKRMVWAPLGAIVLTWPDKRLSFIKQTKSDPRGQYPQGCNLAIYIGPDNFMVEMETCGAEQTLMPGETIYNEETWRVVDQVFDWTDPAPLLKAIG